MVGLSLHTEWRHLHFLAQSKALSARVLFHVRSDALCCDRNLLLASNMDLRNSLSEVYDGSDGLGWLTVTVVVCACA